MKILQKISIALVIGACMLSGAQARERVQILPFDEGLQEQSLVDFRLEVLKAVWAKDVDALKKLSDEHIKLSFGGADKLTDYDNIFVGENAPWDELEWVMTHGGNFEDEEHMVFYAPYAHVAYDRMYEAGYETEQHNILSDFAFIPANKVNLRDAPSPEGNVTSLVSFDSVRMIDYQRDYNREFIEIETYDGQQGFIHSSLVRFTADYRAAMRRDPQTNKWKLIWFLAGD